jgi:membrane protein YdbS with pleckstrin-like domain
MAERLESLVLRLLRVPPEPSAPVGDAGSLRVFRAGPNYLRYRQVVWLLKQLAALSALLFGLLFVTQVLPNMKHGASLVAALKEERASGVLIALTLAEAAAWLIFLLQLPFSYAVVHLDYTLRWYMVTDRSLRVREGLFSLREKTMTFANVQQLSVEQGPLQRLLGLADVHVQSAGGGAAKHGKKGEPGVGESPHEARFRGVANAAEIRDLVRERVRRYRDAGLGDAHELAPQAAPPLPLGEGGGEGLRKDCAPVQAPSPAPTASLAAAQELLAEVRALRAALARD